MPVIGYGRKNPNERKDGSDEQRALCMIVTFSLEVEYSVISRPTRNNWVLIDLEDTTQLAQASVHETSLLE
jgi:hypothetical protein